MAERAHVSQNQPGTAVEAGNKRQAAKSFAWHKPKSRLIALVSLLLIYRTNVVEITIRFLDLSQEINGAFCGYGSGYKDQYGGTKRLI